MQPQSEANHNQTDNSPARQGRPCSPADGIHHADTNLLCLVRIHVLEPKQASQPIAFFFLVPSYTGISLLMPARCQDHL